MGIKKDQTGALSAVQAQITAQIGTEVTPGFPPIAFFGNMNAVNGTPQVAVAGCSYIHQCSGCNALACLQLPPSPADGDAVGFYEVCGTPAKIAFDTGANQYRDPLFGSGNPVGPSVNATLCGSSNLGNVKVLRWSTLTGVWEYVQI